MSALNWLRDKAKEQPESYMTISPESAGEGTKPGLWKIRRWHFSGRLPTNMIHAVKATYSNLVKVQSGDIQTNETLRVGGQYRSEFNNCEFSKTVYEFVA